MKRFSHAILLLAMPLIMWAQELADSIAPYNILSGTCLTASAVGDEAVLKNGTDGLGFYPANSKAVLKANTAFLLSDVLMLIDLATLDNPTGIAPVSHTQHRTDVLYDLQGRVVAQPHAEGVYVKGGKKWWIGRKR